MVHMVPVIAAIHNGVLQRSLLGQGRKDWIKAGGLMTLAPGEDKRHAGGFV